MTTTPTNNTIIHPWEMPQERTELKPWVFVNAPNKQVKDLDEQEQETLREFLDAPTVEITYDLNDDTDYAMPYMSGDKMKIARVSDFVTINGLRWHLQPGKNVIPMPVYEYLMQIPDMRKCTVATGMNLGKVGINKF